MTPAEIILAVGSALSAMLTSVAALIWAVRRRR